MLILAMSIRLTAAEAVVSSSPKSLSAETIILRLNHFVDGVTSLQFTETVGSVPNDFSKAHMAGS